MVSELLTFITGRLNPGIIESTHGLKQSNNQDDQTFIVRLLYLVYRLLHILNKIQFCIAHLPKVSILLHERKKTWIWVRILSFVDAEV